LKKNNNERILDVVFWSKTLAVESLHYYGFNAFPVVLFITYPNWFYCVWVCMGGWKCTFDGYGIINHLRFYLTLALI